MSKLRGRMIAVAGTGVLAALAAVSCAKPHAPSQAGVRPECPHDWTDTSKSHSPQFANGVALAAGIVDIAEYHDCQKFLVDDGHGGLAYGGLEAIFVRDTIDAVYAAVSSASTPPRRRDAARTGAATTANGVTAQTLVSGLPIAIVYSESLYVPLGIKKGFDCVVLQAVPAPVGSSPRYTAWMVPVDSQSMCSPTGEPPKSPQGKQLFVTVKRPYASAQEVDTVPPVARWDFDSLHKQYYIDMSCPGGWCEIHADTAFYPSHAYSSTLPHGRVFRVKGWYDEQYLAKYDEKTNLLSPDSALGSVFPVPELHNRVIGAYTQTDSAWVRVAWVSLDRPSTKYQREFGFEPAKASGTAHGDPPNEVSMCLGSAWKCGVLLHFSTHWWSCPNDTAHSGSTWYARVTSVSRATKYLCVRYRPMKGDQPPGVVRWRWKVKDETIWISCPGGCCEIDPDDLT